MTGNHTVIVVDDDPAARASLRALLEAAHFAVVDFASAGSFLADKTVEGGCLVLDIRMPDMNGLQLQEELLRRENPLPVVITTGHGDIGLAVRAMMAGAVDFLEKPFDDEELIACVRRALLISDRHRDHLAARSVARELISQLTPRERQVLDKLVRGQSNKIAAYELSISPRTIEIYRAKVMHKLNARGLPDLVRTAAAASIPPFGPPFGPHDAPVAAK